MTSLDPVLYKLSSRVVLRQIAPGHIGIVKLIKSRIIQKDASKLVDIAKRIRQIEPTTRVSIICTRNICSKSLALLRKECVEVIYEE